MKENALGAVLIGAPNCGKSTLFNRLARARAPVGNRAGVTVGSTSRRVRGERFGPGCPDIYLTDLPGIRSLIPASADEEVTISSLRDGRPGLIINLLGASTLERCLALTVGIRAEYPGVPMVCAVNMVDELEAAGISLSTEALMRATGIPFVAVSAASGAGLPELRRLIREAAGRAAGKASPGASGDAAERAARGVAESTAHKAAPGGADPPSKTIFPRSDAGRAAFASRVAASALSRPVAAHRPTDLIDALLTRPAVGIPVFLVVMALIFWITFGYVGNILTAFFEGIITAPLGRLIELAASRPGFPASLSSFLSGCLVGGVGAVVSFLPRITLLFVLLSLLEDSGYMARASFIADAPLRRAGLSGRAFIPLLLGFGCGVSAVMSARTLGDRGERLRCILFSPLISCSARAPVYSLIAASFFPEYGWLAVLSVYLAGIAVFLICSGAARAATHDAPPMFIAELPRYRLPRPVVTLRAAAGRAGDFLARAGGVIFISTAAVWLLSYLTPRMAVASSPDRSLLALIAGLISPLLSPLGFGNWRAAAALICGIGAKESIISAFGTLTGGNPALTLAASGIFTPASALSFMVFSSMYLPCAATIPAMRAETGSAKLTAAAIAVMFACAYLVSLAVYLLAGALG